MTEAGTLRTIANWDELSEAERAVAWRRIVRRNRVRAVRCALCAAARCTAPLAEPLAMVGAACELAPRAALR